MKSQGEIEAAICEAVTRFQQDYMGRGPKDIHAYLLGDFVVVRLQGVLTAAEQHLAKSSPSEKGRDLIKDVRTQLIEKAKQVLEVLVEQAAGMKVTSMHHDISTVTGEKFIIFTFDQSPEIPGEESLTRSVKLYKGRDRYEHPSTKGTNMKTIDRTNLRAIERRMTEVLGDLGKELNVSFKIGGASFSPTSAKIQVIASVFGEEGEAITPDRRNFQFICKMYGLEPTHLDRQFQYAGRTYTIKGLRPKSPKFPILVMRDDGREFKMPPEAVLKGLQQADLKATKSH